MKYVNIDQVEPGDVLGRSIYTSDGLTLLQANVQLTVGMINKLRRFGVTMVSLKDPNLQDVDTEEVLSESTRKDAIRNLSAAIQCVQAGKGIDVRGVQKSVNNIVDETLRNRRVLLNLGEIRTNDNALYIHSLNVCMMAVVMGVGLGYSVNQLKELAIGSLLHDIGKVVKDEGDASPYKQNSLENHHTWTGFNLLRKKHEMSIVSAHIALQHHEWVDGSGIPRGLMSHEIHEFGKIVAICNAYDNFISPFSEEEETLPPYEACERIMGLAEKRFDHQMVIQFLRTIAMYPTGTSLKLSTGEVGIVIDQNRGLPSRPVVRIIRKDRVVNERVGDDHEIRDVDLSEETTIFITGILE
ncbi:HD-GYP domain-containing protein [Brevibacillus borstelensis]|jgi:HD-GYP domain-containing protein (c-di-GMP phosphodiesterase class II)|uniref:HD-GYP domain-containing protein n=1 Tax=Brevibacillus borstelensis TaxID=45462 RepID=UPI001FAA136E|nr:HD domain-containing phosphohydrolase [Brevibacillus borstelensis]